MKTRKIMRESKEDTLKEIEREYGAKVAHALDRYCEIKKLDVDDVVSDMSEDGNGMTAWDKFDLWAQKTLKLDIMGNFDDDFDYTGADDDRKREAEFDKLDREKRISTKKSGWKKVSKRGGRGLREHDLPKFDEGRGSEPIDEYFISNWIGDELKECEWVDPEEIEFAGDEPWVEIATPDGDVYRIQVTKVYSGKLGTYLDNELETHN